MLCYARSGGTLLNRTLNNLGNTVVLSEVNPINESSYRAVKNPITTVAGQARQWYGIRLKSVGFTEQILELDLWCKRNYKHLVVRDWTFIDFTDHRLNNFNPPNFSSTIAALRDKVEINQFAFIRDSIDVYLSRNISLNDFYNSYINYVNYLIYNKIALFRYEDFCDDYLATLESICKFTGLSMPVSINPFSVKSNLTGDVKASRGSKSDKVKKLKRRYVIPSHRNRINECELMIKSNSLLGYPTSYESTKRQSFLEKIFFDLERRLRNAFGA